MTDPTPSAPEATRASGAGAEVQAPVAAPNERPSERTACGSCGALVVRGAKKCPACRTWLGEREPAAPDGAWVAPPPTSSTFLRAFLGLMALAATGLVMLVASRESPVGEAPPLTAMPADASSAAADAPPPAAIGPEPEPEPEPPSPPDPNRRWKAREIKVGLVHPLDIAWNPNGKSIYVSADDATLREYKLTTGEILHQASVPAQGDRIRVLFDRYVAVLRHHDAARIPVMDTTAWDRDPALLDLGRSPGDILELPDGRTVVAATADGRRVSRFDLPTGARLANITIPHATGQLFVVRSGGRPYVAALGALTHAGRPAGAWLDLFDPTETPFGATRRSISIGREPRAGAVTSDGGALLVPDRISNTATLLSVRGETEMQSVAVGQRPEAAFLMHRDRYGVTVNSGSRTASVIDLSTMTVRSTLILDGVPRSGVVSPDGRTLFVALGGSRWPPRGRGVAIIAGDPPRVVASLPTGEGAISVAVSKDGARAAVASYWERSITIVEQ